MFVYDRSVIRLRGIPLSDGEASWLARELRAHGGASIDTAERIERAIALGTGLIGTDRIQARAVLAVIEGDERLREIRDELQQFTRSS